MTKKLLLFICLLSLTGCETFQQYQPPESPEGALATDLTVINEKAFQNTKPVSAWWKEIDDPLLTELIEESLQHNLDVNIALANLNEARASVKESDYDRFPTVTGKASISRQRISIEDSSNITADRTFNQFDAGFDASWELDLFGRVSQKIAGEQALYEATVSELNNVYISVAAEVARAYIKLRGTQHRLEIAKRNAKNQNDTYDLTVKLANGGRATTLDTSRAETQLNLTLASIPPLKAQIATTINQLSVLTGKVPDYLYEKLNQTKPLPKIPVSVNVGNVSDLIANRPDITTAERILAASIAQYNVSKTDLFPTVNLLGFLGLLSTQVSTLGTGAAISGFIGPTVSWRAFDLGRVRAQVKQSDARAQAALATYEKTVLTALEEIQSALTEFTHEEERRSILEQASLSSKKSANIARDRYRLGVDAFLDVLDAERTQLETEDALAVSEIQTNIGLIAIYKALGGGWRFSATEVEKNN